MRRDVWVLVKYVEEEPGHPVVFRPIVDFDKGFVDRQRQAFDDEHRSNGQGLVWGCTMTRHQVLVPNSEGRE